MGYTDRVKLIREIEKKRGSRLLCYLTSDRENAQSRVAKDALPIMYEHLRSIGETDKIDVFIMTLGGDTLAAFGMARYLREFTDTVGVLVPEKCYSAGTLFALGGNEIVMTAAGTLSPIDPSITQPLNPVIEVAPGQRQIVSLSVESVAGFKDLVMEDWGLVAEQEKATAFQHLANRVHPIALGDVFRVRQQIDLLARKLLTAHRNDEDDITRIVHTLSKGLGSHDYIISRREARELLGPQVAPVDQELEDLVWDLYKDYSEYMELTKPHNAGILYHELNSKVGKQQQGPKKVTTIAALVESTYASNPFEVDRSISLVKAQDSNGIEHRLPREDVVRNGWCHYEPEGN